MYKKIIFFLFILFFSTFTYAIGKDNQPTADAEWDDAKIVMLHVPGFESFFISMFPIASGYNKTFNQIGAKQEFKLLIDTLEYYGIQVYTTEHIFLNNVIDNDGQVIHGQQLFELQHFAKKFLNIKSNNLKEPLAFNLDEYKTHVISSIDPKNLVNLIFLNPTINLYQEVGHLMANNTYSPKFSVDPICNFFYMNDLGITTSKGIIVSKLSNPQRQKEIDIYKYLLSVQNINPIYEINGSGRLEGGDFIPANSVCFIGQGIRTNREAIEQLLKNNTLGTKTVIVVKDNLKLPFQMHLIKYFNFLNKNTVVFAENRMEGDDETKIDIYERSSSKNEEYKLIRKDVSFAGYMKDALRYNIIPVSMEDQQMFAMDYFVVKANTIIAPEGVSSKYKQTLREHGINAIWLDIDNIKAGYGGIHSVIQVLKRKYVKKEKETTKNSISPENTEYINL